MNQYKIAGKVVSFCDPCKAPWEESVSSQFLCPDVPNDAVFDVSEEEFQKANEERFDNYRQYIESMVLFSKIRDWLLKSDCLFLHASAASLEGNGYCFTGHSGAGKSTHANLWKQTFRDAIIINDDLVTVRKLDDGSFVVGTTPWHGKEAIVNNVEVPLKGIARIVQAKENRITRLSRQEALDTLMGQIHFTEDTDMLNRQMDLVEEMLNKVPFWRLECTIDPEAALLSQKVMSEADL